MKSNSSSRKTSICFVIIIVAVCLVHLGATNPIPESRIIDGLKTLQTVSFMAYYYICRPDGNRICGGTLIDSGHVLTAAHCVRDFDKEKTKSMVLINSLNVYVEVSPSVFRTTIYDVKLHPDWKGTTSDVAIITLAREVPRPYYGSFVNPVKLNTDKNVKLEGMDVEAFGWGDTAPFLGRPSNVLLYSNLRIMTKEECDNDLNYYDIKQSDKNKILLYYDSHMCYHDPNVGHTDIGKNAKQPCSGDSGGPLMAWMDGTYKQVGIIYMGAPQDYEDECVKNIEYAVRVASFAEWIEANKN